MRVVLAGAGGVVGRSLIPLLSEQHAVVGLDRPEVAPVGGTQWLVADIRDWRGLQNAFAAVHPVDAVVSVVSAPHAGLGEKDQARAEFDANVSGTWTLANQALDAGVRRFVYLSNLDADEPHGLSKRFGEQVLEHLCTTRGATAVALRLRAVHVPDVAERGGVAIEELAAAILVALSDGADGFSVRDLAHDVESVLGDWEAPLAAPLGSVPLPHM